MAATNEVSRIQRVERRLGDLASIDVGAFVENDAALKDVFVADLIDALDQADLLVSELISSGTPKKQDDAEDRRNKAADLAVASRVQRRAADVARLLKAV